MCVIWLFRGCSQSMSWESLMFRAGFLLIIKFLSSYRLCRSHVQGSRCKKWNSESSEYHIFLTDGIPRNFLPARSAGHKIRSWLFDGTISGMASTAVVSMSPTACSTAFAPSSWPFGSIECCVSRCLGPGWWPHSLQCTRCIARAFATWFGETRMLSILIRVWRMSKK